MWLNRSYHGRNNSAVLGQQRDIVIEINDLVKTFGEIRAVDSLSLEVERGVICGFLGPNGSGKSTTLRMLTSLIRPDSGTIKVFGLDSRAHRHEVLGRTGALIERPNFYEHLTARKNLEILQRYSIGKVDQARVTKALELVNLIDRKESKVRTFSDGMKQRLGLAQALLDEPELLILDEPFNSLDPQGVRDMRELVLRLNVEHGITVLVSSHNLDEIEKLCSHMVLIRKGKVIERGLVAELVKRGRYPTVISVDEPVRAIEALRSQFPDSEASQLPNGDITLMLQPQDVPGIAPLMVGLDIAIHSIRDHQTLESFFLSIASE